jgi:hypothetical protein
MNLPSISDRSLRFMPNLLADCSSDLTLMIERLFSAKDQLQAAV